MRNDKDVEDRLADDGRVETFGRNPEAAVGPVCTLVGLLAQP